MNIGKGLQALKQGAEEVPMRAPQRSPTQDDSQIDALDADITNSEGAARFGLWVLGIGLGGFLLWASLAPLDEGVPTSAMVSIDTRRHTVQHLQGGMVREVYVREGQTVSEGELLLRLDDANVRAAFESARQTVAAIRENMIAQEAVLNGLRSAERNRRDQLSLIEKELSGVRGLVKEGFAPAVQQLQLERLQAEVSTSISDTLTNQQRTSQTLLEFQHQLKAAQQRLAAAEQELKRLEVRSTTNGQVVGLAISAVGAVLQPTQRIMDIVPQGKELTIEAQVAPHFIDRVRTGDPVDVRFSSFSGDPQLVVPGELFSLSQDVLNDPATMQPYYLARVRLTEEGIKKLGSRSMQPGMPAEVIIKTGSRTMLNYLLHPLTKRIAASLKEE